MKKFGIKSLFAVVLILVLVFSLVACVKPCEQHVDENGDKVCDTCKEAFTCKHVDKNKDGKCDKCKAPVSDGPSKGKGDAAAFFQGLWDNAAPIGGTEIADEEDLAVEVDMSLALANGNDMLIDLGASIALVLDRTNDGANSAAKVGIYDHDNNTNIVTIYYFLNDNMNFYVDALGQQVKVAVDYNYNNEVAPMLNAILNTTFTDLLGADAVAGLPNVAQESIMSIINNLVDEFGANWNLDNPINAVTGLLGLNIGELLADNAQTLAMVNPILSSLADNLNIEYTEIDPEAIAESDAPILDLLMSVGPILFSDVEKDGNYNKAGLDFSEEGLVATVIPMLPMVMPMIEGMIGLPENYLNNFGITEMLQNFTELSLEYTVEDSKIDSFGINVGFDTNDKPFRLTVLVNEIAIKGVDAAEAASVFGVNKANFKDHYSVETELNIEISEGALVVKGFDFEGTYNMTLKGELDLVNVENNGSKVYASLKKDGEEIAKLTFIDTTLAIWIDSTDETVQFIVNELKVFVPQAAALAANDEWLKGAVLALANGLFTEEFESIEALAGATSLTLDTTFQGFAITDVSLADIKLHGTRILGEIAGMIGFGGAESSADETEDGAIDAIIEAAWQPNLMALLTAISEVVNGEFGGNGLTAEIDNIGEFILSLFDAAGAVGPETIEELCYGNGKDIVGLFTLADGTEWDAKEWSMEIFGGCGWISEDIFMDLMATSVKVQIKSSLEGSIELENGDYSIAIDFAVRVKASDSAVEINNSVFPDTTAAGWYSYDLN